MACFEHPNQEAVSTCESCTRLLCRSCTRRFSIVRCEPCLRTHNKDVLRGHVATLATVAALYALNATVLFKEGGPAHGASTLQDIVAGALAACGLPCMYFGWRFLGRHTPRTFLVLPLAGWFAFFAVRLILSAVVGILVAPFEVFRCVREVIRIRRTTAWLARAAVRPEPPDAASPAPAILVDMPSAPH